MSAKRGSLNKGVQGFETESLLKDSPTERFGLVSFLSEYLESSALDHRVFLLINLTYKTCEWNYIFWNNALLI